MVSAYGDNKIHTNKLILNSIQGGGEGELDGTKGGHGGGGGGGLKVIFHLRQYILFYFYVYFLFSISCRPQNRVQPSTPPPLFFIIFLNL